MPSAAENIISEKFNPIIAGMAYANRFGEENYPVDCFGTASAVTTISSMELMQKAKYIKSPLSNQADSQKLLGVIGPSNYSANTQSNLLNRLEDSVQEIIFQINGYMNIRYCNKLATAILRLFYLAKEEDSYSIGISVASLQNFFNFIRSNVNLKLPMISLSPEHNIYASWRGENKRVFSSHFLPNGDSRFVIFRPNKLHPEKFIRVSGVVTSDMLIDTLKPYCIDEWVFE